MGIASTFNYEHFAIITVTVGVDFAIWQPEQECTYGDPEFLSWFSTLGKLLFLLYASPNPSKV